ncbi:MAG: META domain-containing protein [Cytophagales bacterium]|nr:META domain-containing protein [Cytophagales bacterium]
MLFLAIFCSSCEKEDLTESTDITKSSWKLKCIEIDGDRVKQGDYYYCLSFNNDSSFKLVMKVNSGGGTANIKEQGVISFSDFSTTEVAGEDESESDLVKSIGLINSYQVLDNTLLLFGENCELEFEKE